VLLLEVFDTLALIALKIVFFFTNAQKLGLSNFLSEEIMKLGLCFIARGVPNINGN